MNLEPFDNAIGVSDLLAHRDCPRRMSYAMRRHVGGGVQSGERTPEATTYYGSAIHEVLQAVEEGYSDADAIQRAWNAWGRALDPPDLDLLREDLQTYRRRDQVGVRSVAVEEEMRVPLMRRDGKLISFRFKLDRLYQRLDDPGVFVHVDYKSSRWARSAREVHEDPQLWAYNWAIHEAFPECDQLEQVYDQLRYGQLLTRKDERQRQLIHEWLCAAAVSVIEDESFQADGLLRPAFNQWCAYCSLMESCSVVDDLTEFALVRIAALAPTEKVARKVIARVDPARVAQYTEQLERARAAQRILARFESAVKDLLRDMPAARRVELGYELSERAASVFTPAAARELHAALGERFYDVVRVTKTAVESTLAADPVLRDWALTLAEPVKSTTTVVTRRAD